MLRVAVLLFLSQSVLTNGVLLRSIGNTHDDNIGCSNIHTLFDCRCGSKPCNYCVKCPCYGCLSKKTFELSSTTYKTTPPTNIDINAVKEGKSTGNMDQLVNKNGGSFIPEQNLDKEGNFNPEICVITKQHCAMMATLHQFVNKHREELYYNDKEHHEVVPNVVLNDVVRLLCGLLWCWPVVGCLLGLASVTFLTPDLFVLVRSKH